MKKLYLILLLIFTSCYDDVVLNDLLKSQQWEIAYCQIQSGGNTLYSEEYQYRIQFRTNGQIAVFKQSGDVMYGTWNVTDNKFLDISMNEKNMLSNKWEMVKYYVWGYDQQRLTFKCDTIEFGIKRY